MTDKITFNDLGLPEFILKAVSDFGFETPQTIQQACIPALLEGRDVLGMAQTGSGKTAAFSLPILAKIDPAAKHPQLLVMAPTRELAIQVADACEHFMKYAKGINIVILHITKVHIRYTMQKFCKAFISLCNGRTELVAVYIKIIKQSGKAAFGG